MSAVMFKPRVWVMVRRGKKGYGVYVQTPDGREFLLKTHKGFSEAARSARKEARWWEGQGYPVSLVGLEG
ncbi:MAG: hypothetical protein QME87_14180 [Bacillota bacterium]|nr:hypothetical protein [Bacillota bacterium]